MSNDKSLIQFLEMLDTEMAQRMLADSHSVRTSSTPIALLKPPKGSPTPRV